MTHHEQMERWKREKAFIKRHKTGTAREFAKEMKISLSTFRRDIKHLRLDEGLKIEYSDIKRTYYFDD